MNAALHSHDVDNPRPVSNAADCLGGVRTLAPLGYCLEGSRMNIIDFYRTQLRVMWQWKGGPSALLWRFVLTSLIAAVAFLVTAWLLPGLNVNRFATALLAVVLIAVFNAVVRSLVLVLTAQISLVLTGVLVIVFQVLAFLVVAQLVTGVTIARFTTALVGSFIYAIVNSILTSVLAVDQGGSYYGILIRALLARQSEQPSDKPGVVIMQIDGLAYPILAGRIRAGSVNTIASWVRDRSHRLSRWEAMLPSMTSGSQAGILHGSNDGIPAFRWYERDRQHLMVSSSPVDAAEMVRRLSNGQGLLSNNGVSICNLLTGDATRSYLTTASLKTEGQGIGNSKAFTALFFSPTGYLRSFTMFLGEFIKERMQARRTRRSGVQPQLHRDLKYAAMRAASNVILRDMNTALIIYEMYRGANVIYADFTDYDEIAHHSGPERVEALQALDGIDAALATLVQAAADAPRPYKFIVLSDHGQSLGATFKQRYGQSLGEVVRDLMGGRATVVQTETRAEGSTFVNSALSEVTHSSGVTASVARAALASRTTDGVVDLDEDEIPPPADASTIAVVGSGNLGLVYFTGHNHRLTLEELDELHPNLVLTLARHPGVAMLMVRSSVHGPVVFGANGARYLAEHRVVGQDPTELFGPHAVQSLEREDAMTHAPDLLLISQYDPELGEVAAFEELIGSHGGLGGPQTEPFILHPAEWELDEDVPLGAPAIYRNIRRWLESIGIELGAAATTADTGSLSETTPVVAPPAPTSVR
ncbi:MAG: phage holin family protein [Chloroflexi bacterium]|nr:phage holin family protein [Chloroflexota bacterium]